MSSAGFLRKGRGVIGDYAQITFEGFQFHLYGDSIYEHVENWKRSARKSYCSSCNSWQWMMVSGYLRKCAHCGEKRKCGL